MSAGKPIVLIDTGIWLDLFLLDRPGRKDAQALIRYALNDDIPLAYASHSALDVYAKAGICAKRFFRESGQLTDAQARVARTFAWDCAARMREVATPVPADVSDFYFAEKFRPLHGDFEDNLVLAACSRAKANYLVTTGKCLLRHADISAKVPTEMLSLLKSGLARGNDAEEPMQDSAHYLRRWLTSTHACL
jgi:predicted nucleic acid-binding protein